MGGAGAVLGVRVVEEWRFCQGPTSYDSNGINVAELDRLGERSVVKHDHSAAVEVAIQLPL